MGTGNDFGLLILSAFYHPDKALKDHLRRVLADEIPAPPLSYTDEEVARFFSSEPGTPLEPFCLRAVHLDVATYTLRFALSSQLTRFRVVSQDTLGNRGGLVVTSNLKGYYQERYLCGKKKATATTNDRFVAPGQMPYCLSEIRNRFQDAEAACCVGQDGYHIEVEGLGWTEKDDKGSFLARLQANSVVFDRGQFLDRLGLRFGYSSGRLILEPISPEATIQFTALMHNRAVLSFVFDQWRIFIRLEPPQDDKLALSMLITQNGQALSGWLAIPASPDITLSDDVYRSIASWIHPHDAWIRPAFLESIL